MSQIQPFAELCSQVLSLLRPMCFPIRPMGAELWRCGNENALLVHLVPVCLVVHLPAMHDPVPADLLFSDFQTFVVNMALDLSRPHRNLQ